MYCDTCINRSCSKAETLFRRTDTLDLICFLYASLSHISKAETVKRALLQTDNFFSVIRLKNNLLYPDTKKNFRNSEKQRIKLNIFVNFLKKKHFFTLQSSIFFISIWSFEGVQLFWLELAIFYSKLLSATNQQLFLRHWKRYRPSNHIAPLYELLVSVLWLTLSFGEVSKTCRRMH